MSGRVFVSAEPYRNPKEIQKILSENKYAIFFTFVHGELIPNSQGPSFKTPENTVVIQTGAGDAYGCMTMTTYDRYLLPRFLNANIQETFSKFLGSRGNVRNATLDNLIFNTPRDTTLDKYIYLRQADLNDTSNYWGVYGLNNTTDVFLPELTKVIIDKTTEGNLTGRKYRQSDFVNFINSLPMDGIQLRIVIFINCVVASKGVAASEFSESTRLAGVMTHYGRENTVGRFTGVKYLPGPSSRVLKPVGANTPLERERAAFPVRANVFESSENTTHGQEELYKAYLPNNNAEDNNNSNTNVNTWCTSMLRKVGFLPAKCARKLKKKGGRMTKKKISQRKHKKTRKH